MARLLGTTTQYTFLPGHNLQNAYTYDAGGGPLKPAFGLSGDCSYDAASNRKGLAQPRFPFAPHETGCPTRGPFTGGLQCRRLCHNWTVAHSSLLLA